MGDVVQRLRRQLQNCVNHLERASRHWNGTASDYDACIESANRCLYETLDADPYAELEALRERVRAMEDAQCEVCGSVMPLPDNPPG